MKVLVIGAGGVIGQHLMISVPEGVEAVFTRRRGEGLLYSSLDLLADDLYAVLDEINPDVIVNLAGENRVDEVEKTPKATFEVNVTAVWRLSMWCKENDRYLIQVSSQAATAPEENEYGRQKKLAEDLIKNLNKWTVVRPTFVLGIRPFPGIGRENPAEKILAGRETESVYDRFFSVSFAWDVAAFIWGKATSTPAMNTFNVGNLDRMSRLSVAHALGVYPKRIEHSSLNIAGIAPRPLDTTYTEAWSETPLSAGMSRLEAEFGQREQDTLIYRAKEIAAYFKIPWGKAVEKLKTGFGPLHNAVSEDFRKANPKGDKELLAWYRGTDSYIWELSAYHLDPGFNYKGTVKGIVDALKSLIPGGKVLCLGDGTGDFSLAFDAAGFKVSYNDLFCSNTAHFAASRFLMRNENHQIDLEETMSFEPSMADVGEEEFDAVVSFDFLEHVPNVEAWVKSIHSKLHPGGYFVAQNAFNMGSGEAGDMPMHLAVNDHYEKDWDPLLFSLGFSQMASNWYQKSS